MQVYRVLVLFLLGISPVFHYYGGVLIYAENVLQTPSNKYGIPIWNHTYGRFAYNMPADIITLQDGGFLMTGYLENYGLGDGYAFLMRLDDEGNQLWNHTYYEGLGGRSLLEIDDGGYLIAGYSGWLIRTDETGVVLWNQTYSDETNSLRINSVIERSLGGFALVGFEAGQGYDLILLLTDDNGRLLYRKIYSGPSDLEIQGWGNDYGFDIIEHSTGGYVIAGTMDDKISLIRVDTIGNLLWRQSYHSSGQGDGYSLVETTDGGIVIAGEYAGSAKVIRTDSRGDVVWESEFSGVRSNVKLVQKNDGSLAITGTKYNTAWIARIASNGTLLWERMYDYPAHNSLSQAIDTFGSNDFVIACGIIPTETGEWGSQIWVIAITDISDSSEPIPVGLYSLSAIGLVASVLVIAEILKRRNNERR